MLHMKDIYVYLKAMSLGDRSWNLEPVTLENTDQKSNVA